MTPEQRKQFVLDHRTAIFGYSRDKDGPAMSIVYYCLEERRDPRLDHGGAGQGQGHRTQPKVSLCVLDEQWPPSYLQVYCDAAIDTDFDSVVDVMMNIAGVMAGAPMSEDVRPLVAEGARRGETGGAPATPIRHLLYPAAPRPQRGRHRPRPASRNQCVDAVVSGPGAASDRMSPPQPADDTSTER